MIKKILKSSLVGLLLFAKITQGATFNQIHAYGDSLSDNGNLFALSGEYLPLSPYFGGRFTNGLTWIEILTTQLGLSPSALHNYAFGASKTSSDKPPGLLEQVEAYLEQHTPEPDSLYVIWSGANNYLFNVESAGPDVRDTVNNIEAAIKKLSAGGARYFVLLNLPDMGMTPWAIKEDKRSGDHALGHKMGRLSQQHNAVLSSDMFLLSNALKAQGYDVTIQIFDVIGMFYDLILNKEKYGMLNAEDACYTGNLLGGYGDTCADPDKYVFWDSVHPTAATHRILAEKVKAFLIENGLEAVPMSTAFSKPTPSELNALATKTMEN